MIVIRPNISVKRTAIRHEATARHTTPRILSILSTPSILSSCHPVMPPLTREVRAANARVYINSSFDTKQKLFLDFVIQHYATWVSMNSAWTNSLPCCA